MSIARLVTFAKPPARRLFHALVEATLGGLPRQSRYDGAVDLARALSPPLRLIPPFINDFEDRTAIALRSVLIAATDCGIEIDPALAAPDPEILRGVHDPGRGIIACGAHMSLAPLFLRYLHDHGLTPVGLSERPGWRICGTRTPFDALAPTTDVLMQARTHLKQGRVFALMIDRREPDDAIPIPGRSMFIRLPIFRFAVRTDTPLVFFATWLRPDRAVVIEIERAPSAERDPLAIAQACAKFFSRTMAAASRTTGVSPALRPVC